MSVTVQMTRLVPGPNVKSPGASLTTVDTPQLSLVLSGTPITTLLTVHIPTSAFVITFAGQVIVGGSLSLIVTLKSHVADSLLLASMALQLTAVVPSGNVAPEVTGSPLVVQDTVTPGQLSLGVTVKFTAAEHCPGAVLDVMLP